MNLNAPLGHPKRGHGLDAEIDSGNREAPGAHRTDHVWLGSRDLVGEVRTLHARGRQYPRQKLGIRSLGITAAE